MSGFSTTYYNQYLPAGPPPQPLYSPLSSANTGGMPGDGTADLPVMQPVSGGAAGLAAALGVGSSGGVGQPSALDSRANRLAYALKNWPEYTAPKSAAEAAVQGLGHAFQGWTAGRLADTQQQAKTAHAQQLALALAPGDTEKQAQIVGAINSGIDASVFGPALEFKLGLGSKNYMKLAPGESILDANTGKLVYGSPNPYNGQSMDAQNWNVILKGDSASPEYAAAYSQLFQTPKMVAGSGANGEITQTPYFPPIPPGVKPPSGMAPAEQPQVDSPAAAAPATPAAPAGPPAGPAVAGGAPASGVRTGTPIVTGQGKPTERQTANRQLFHLSSQELPIVEKNFTELTKLPNQAASLGGDLTMWMTSPGYQEAYNSLKMIIANHLYSVSGATANPGEVKTQTTALMPFPGESAESLADKIRRIRNIVEATQYGAELNAPIGNMPPAPGAAPVENPPAPGARKAPDGNWYVPDPSRPGKYLMVQP